MQQAAREKERFHWLEPPADLGELTIADVQGAENPEDHSERVRAWAKSTWSAWAQHHDMFRHWLRTS